MANVIIDFCKEYENLPLNTQFLLKFKLDGTYKWIGGTMHVVSLTCSNRSVTLSTKIVMVEDAWAFKTFIQSKSAGPATLEISVDGIVKKKVLFKFHENKDVFNKAKNDLLVSELKYVAPEVNKEPRIAEYSGNYCMAASERGLSELLGDITHFYAVERTTHKRKNKVSFSGKSAVDRGKYFQKKGFTSAYHAFNGYRVNNVNKDLIYNASDDNDAKVQYGIVKYDIIEFNATGKSALTKIFEDDLRNKELGFHIYYFTVTDGFHTLVLIINKFSDPCNPTYEIWDQHGLSSSHGPMTDIAEGIRRQTSWTFANSCLNRYIKKKTQHIDSTTTFLWKIKQK
ncbi:hypothetical protein [Arenibacter echinorum]|uniref:Uncharacterized protein n=1 Tax=Arenibacter echinorum TaxID=440515 RepID=A0A327QUG4_9FLAO|nr:hypothetical protein [Arenibacter echinorum]RAJ08010.1 hypothetical protein LV92_03573 [Arenibacter echinorum]